MSTVWRRGGGGQRGVRMRMVVTVASVTVGLSKVCTVTAADRAFMYVKRLQRGWQGHFNVPSVQLEDTF